MQSHAQMGAEILGDADSELMSMAQSVALTHHERWDGSGYPRGLKGEEIPIEGRIVAMADVFDALTSDRPYKKAWTVEEASQLIAENSGTHFDPQLVALYNGAADEFDESSQSLSGARRAVRSRTG